MNTAPASWSLEVYSSAGAVMNTAPASWSLEVRMTSWCIDSCPLCSEVVLYWGVYSRSFLSFINSVFVEKKWSTLVKMCFYCFMHAGITCTCIF